MQISEGISKKTNRLFLAFLIGMVSGLISANYDFVHEYAEKKDLCICKCLKISSLFVLLGLKPPLLIKKETAFLPCFDHVWSILKKNGFFFIIEKFSILLLRALIFLAEEGEMDIALGVSLQVFQ